MANEIVSAADARRRLPELLGRVADGEAFVIARAGKPVARLVPLREGKRPHLADVAGWLDDDDPFFDAVDAIVKARERHAPRVARKRAPAERGGEGRGGGEGEAHEGSQEPE